MSKILVTGSANGLGKEIVRELEPLHDVIEYDIEYSQNEYSQNVLYPRIGFLDHLDVLVNCAAVNKLDWLENFDEADWDSVIDVNVKGVFKMTQACLPMLIKSKGTVLNIVSNAAHVPMTCSLAYNASKGAVHIMTLQLARELTKKYGITVFGISPNKLKGTAMSVDIEKQVLITRGWTEEEAQQYQLQTLLCREETDPKLVAEFIAFLLQDKEHHKYLTGCVLPYGA